MLPAFRRGLYFFDATLLCVHLSLVDAIGRLLLGQGSGRAWHAPDGVLVGLQRDAEVLGLLSVYSVRRDTCRTTHATALQGRTRSSFEPSMLSQRNAWKCAAALRTMMIRPSPNPTHMRSPCTLLRVSAAHGAATGAVSPEQTLLHTEAHRAERDELVRLGLVRPRELGVHEVPAAHAPFMPTSGHSWCSPAVHSTCHAPRAPEDCNAETDANLLLVCDTGNVPTADRLGAGGTYRTRSFSSSNHRSGRNSSGFFQYRGSWCSA